MIEMKNKSLISFFYPEFIMLKPRSEFTIPLATISDANERAFEICDHARHQTELVFR
jgi:hypothetical protein